MVKEEDGGAGAFWGGRYPLVETEEAADASAGPAERAARRFASRRKCKLSRAQIP